MKHVLSLTIILIVVSTFYQCSSQSGTDPAPDNPVPTLNSLEPASKVSHLPDFTLTVKGTSFVSGSRVVFDDAVKATTFVSSTELACDITSGDITPVSASMSGGSGLSAIMSTSVPVLVRNPAPGGGDSNAIDFSIRDNHNFFDPEATVETTLDSYSPKLAVDYSGNINMVWFDNNHMGSTYVLFSRSTTGGSSWSTPVSLTDSLLGKDPTICLGNSGDINVVYQDWNWDGGIFEIFFRRSTDSGASWSTPVNISKSTLHSYKPAVTIDSTGNIYVVWREQQTMIDNDILFSRSSDNGASWDTPANLSDNADSSKRAVIGVSDTGNVYVAWQDNSPGNWDILFRRSTDAGATWSPRVNISNDTSDSIDPSMAVDSQGNINLAWTNQDGIVRSIVFSRSTDTGNSWSPVLRISNKSEAITKAAIATDSAGNINLAWDDFGPGSPDIMFCRSTDGGTRWSPTFNISKATAISRNPAIAVDHLGNINVAWQNLPAGWGNIYFAGSTR